MYNKNVIYIPRLDARGHVGWRGGGCGGEWGLSAGVLSEPLLCWVDGHVVVVAAHGQVRLQGDKDITVLCGQRREKKDKYVAQVAYFHSSITLHYL